MKRNLLALAFLLTLFFSSRAQSYVAIPDSGFGNFLAYYAGPNNSGLLSCMTGDAVNGWYLDVSCADVLNTTSMDFTVLYYSSVNFSDITGIQYFPNLEYLDISAGINSGSITIPPLPNSIKTLRTTTNIGGFITFTNMPASLEVLYASCVAYFPYLPNGLKYMFCGGVQTNNLPALPDSLRVMDVSGNGSLTIMPALPARLDTLICNNARLDSLPTLPARLKYLECSFSNGNMQSLPALPSGLTYLNCSSNYITSIPALPASLKYFNCSSNFYISSLPALPSGLQYLNCGGNQITSLPTLGSSLTDLFCDGNQLTTLPTLSYGLLNLRCGQNNITSYPVLPATLQTFFCADDTLTPLPSLPNGLTALDVRHTGISSLPSFPPTLAKLWCGDNPLLTSLPPLPATLTDLDCRGNSGLYCLPRIFANQLLTCYLANSGITCVPNRFGAYNVDAGFNPSTMPLCVASTGCDFYYNIAGNVHTDTSTSCTADSLYPASMLRNMKVQLRKNGNVVQQFYTFSSGGYSFKTDSLSSYTVTVDTAMLPLAVACPASGIRSVSLTPADSVHRKESFGMSCLGADYNLACIYGARFRPAFTTAVSVYAGNVAQRLYGTACGATSAGIVTTVISGPASYASPAAGALTPSSVSGNTLTYNIADLSTVNSNSFGISVATNNNAAVGSLVCITSTITSAAPDVNVANNTLTECFAVRNSHDPNLKEVYPADSIRPTQDWLTYTIHFQNTGNDTAYTVIVKDTLSQNLNASSFQYLASSHHAVIQLLDHAMTFTFPHIDLVDSATNPPLSEGWIQYKVRPNANLAHGVRISNTASIIFDNNAAIVTNTVANTVSATAAICSNVYTTLSDTICSGGSVSVGAHTYTATGTSIDTIVIGSGCDSIVTLRLTVSSVIPSVSITSSPLVCNYYSDSFYATPVNGGASPSYTWYKNGVALPFSLPNDQLWNTPLGNGDSVWVVMTSSATCASPASVSSNHIIANLPVLVPSVSVSASATSITAGTSVTFLATPTNGGFTPSYQWYKNGATVGTNSATYITNTLSNNDSVWCVMTSSSACASPATATSTHIHITVASACSNVYTTLSSGVCDSYHIGTHTYTSSGNYTDTLTSSGGCDSIVSLRLTINTAPRPILTASGSGCLGIDSLMLVGITGGAQLNWYLGGALALIDTVGIQTISTVAGGNGGGSALNQMEPVDVFVDSLGYTYVLDNGNDRVLKFAPGSSSATNGVVVAGGNGTGAALNQLAFPLGIFVSRTGDVYVSDADNYRVLKFPAGSTSATNGTIVAGGNSNGIAANQLQYARGIFVDAAGNLYVADQYNNRVQKFPAGSTSATNGVTVAGGNGVGTAANQLNFPGSVSMDAAGNLYVSDVHNFRVQKFPPGSTSATNGITVAGGNGMGTQLNQLHNSQYIKVDSGGNVYVSDDNNHRVLKFPSGSSSATYGIIVDGNGSGVRGFTAHELNFPAGICQDKSGNMYIVDGLNYRIQKCSPALEVVYRPATAGDYTVTYSTSQGCTSAMSDTVVLYSSGVPSVSITASGTSITAGTSVTFLATPTNGGFTPSYQWYKNGATVGTNSATYITNTLSNNDSVWCVLTSSSACASPAIAASSHVHITVATSVIPSVSITSSSLILCSTSTDSFIAVPVNGGSPAYQWYKNGATVGVNAAVYIATNVANNDSVWVVMTSSLSNANPATAMSNKIIVSRGVTRIPKVTIAASHTILCTGVTDTFFATPTFGGTAPSYQWYQDGIPVGINSSIYVTSPSHNVTITVNMTSNQLCATPSVANSCAVPVVVNPEPAAPSLTVSGSGCTGFDSLTLSGIGAGRSLIWYLGSTALLNTDTIYTQSTVAGGAGSVQTFGNITSVFVDAQGYLYVADGTLSQVLKFPPNSTSATAGVIIAGGNGAGSAANQLNFPVNIFVDRAGNLYVSDANNYRVQKFPAGSTSATNATTVAGGNGTGFNSILPRGLYVDSSGSLYVADVFNQRIVKYPPGSTSVTIGVTVGGGNGSGAAANQLQNPHGLSMDAAGNIYVVDYSNFRVQKFPACSNSSTNAITVAGGVGTGYAANQLFVPGGVFVDSAEKIYLIDQNRIKIFGPQSLTGSNPLFIGGSTVASSGSNQFSNATDIFVDPAGNIYIADQGNGRVQKWVHNGLQTHYMPVSTGSYTATLTSTNGCASAFSDTVTISSSVTPSVSVTASATTITSGTSVTFTATPANGGNTPSYQWYKNGVAVGTNSFQYNSNTLANNDSVWCVLTSSSACASPAIAASSHVHITVASSPLSASAPRGLLPWCTILGSTHLAVTATGGTAPYQYSLSQTGGYQSSNMFYNLPVPSVVTFWVRDTTGATYSFRDTLTPATYSISVNTTDATGPTNADGQATVNQSGGTAPYVFTWYDNFSHTLPSGLGLLPGLYYVDVRDSNGCDTSLTFNIGYTSTCTNVHASFYDTICDGTLYQFGSRYYIHGGTYYDTVAISGGCDSFKVLHLYAHPTIHVSAAAVTYNYVCSGTSVTLGGSPTGSGGTGHLSYAWNSTNTSSFFFIANPTDVITTNTVYTVTVTDSLGCTAKATDTFIVVSAIQSSISQTICSGSSYTFGGHSLTSGGSYYDTLTASGGCDSIVTLTLTVSSVIPSVSITSSLLVCDYYADSFYAHPVNGGASPSYQWYRNGVALPVSLPHDQLWNTPLGNGDSVWVVMTSSVTCASPATATSNHIRANLPVLVPSVSVSASATSIAAGNTVIFLATPANGGFSPSYQWYKNGVAVGTNSVQYITNTLSNNDSVWCVMTSSSLCASPTTATSSHIHMTVSGVTCRNVYVTVNDTICSGSSVTINAHSYTASGVYGDTMHLASGCDSVVALHLLVKAIAHDTISQSICAGDSVRFGGIYHRAAGYYSQRLTGRNGCDSFSVLHLTVNALPVVTLNWSVFVNAGVFVASGSDTMWEQNCGVTHPLPFRMLGGQPAGGFYSGTFIHNDTFTYPAGPPFPSVHVDTVTYTYIDTHGCRASAIDSFSIAICVGINETPAANIHLYPNPNSGSFTLETMQQIGEEYQIYDMLGQTIQQRSITADVQKIDMSDVAPAVYTLVVKGKTGSVRLTVIR